MKSRKTHFEKYELVENSRAHILCRKKLYFDYIIALLHKLKFKTLNFEATCFNTLFKFNSPLISKLTTKYFGIFFASTIKASDAVSYILSMKTDQIVNNYTLWSTNCPRAEYLISIARTSRGSFELTKDIAM